MAARRLFIAILSGLLSLTAAGNANATAIFGVVANASLKLLSIDHAGLGDGVSVQGSYEPERTHSGYDGDVYGLAYSEGFVGDRQIDLSSYAFGKATNGSGYGSTSISALFEIDNDSETELTAHFSVTWLLAVETMVDSGLASAMGGIHVLSSVGGIPFEDSIALTKHMGAANTSSGLTRTFTMVVPPHEGHYFFVSLFAEGSSSSSPRQKEVPEPITTSLLAAALVGAVLAGARRRNS